MTCAAGAHSHDYFTIFAVLACYSILTIEERKSFSPRFSDNEMLVSFLQ